MHFSEGHADALQDAGFSGAFGAGRGEDALGSQCPSIREFVCGGCCGGQLGNPEDAEKPNKSYYDPRKWLCEAEFTMVKRAQQSRVDHSNVI